MRLVLIGDGASPHLAKWARALEPRVDLYAVSSRGFAEGFAVPPSRRLALDTRPAFEGGNAGLLITLPRVAAWLRRVRPDWIHAHYLTSHGTLAWLAQSLLGAPGRLVGSAWGSDILVAPERSIALRWLTRRVLAACTLATSDSAHMAARMQLLGAREVMTFPFGLEALPTPAADKDERLFFANRALEPIYAPDRVLAAFGGVAREWPDVRLVVANDGSLRRALERQAAPLGERVRFVGRLDAAAQAQAYGQARWYLSLPESDSVSVSVLEAMAHGCIPLLSDLPANGELVEHGRNGLLLAAGATPAIDDLTQLAARAGDIAAANRAWVAEHAMWTPCVERFVARLAELGRGGGR
jgi:glycosyltransferase involved in cell wall biosynthesis